MTNVPTSLPPGVHVKRLLTGLPPVGRAGLMVAPAGRPATFKVTVSPVSGSFAVTVNDAWLPAATVCVEPQVGEVNAGGWFTCGTSWIRKSTGMWLFTVPPGPVRSSTITCVEYSVLNPDGPSVAPWVSQV